MSRIRLATEIHAPMEHVFDLARDIDLHAMSMAASGEHAIDGRKTGEIELGETVTWRARHFGLWWTLTSRIVTVDAPHLFVDEQVSGPFSGFRHAHRFQAIPAGTVMTDDWEHVAPFGPFGRLADRLFLKRHMRQLLETRNRALKATAEKDL